MTSASARSSAVPSDGTAQGAAPHSIRRCLIVDDDAGIRRLIAYNLGKLGVATSECSTVSAVEPALSENPDLIFLDLGLDQGDETSVLSLLAERGFAGRVQIVSGGAAEMLEEVRAWGRDRGLAMLPPLTKPFRSSAIKSLVESGS